MRSAMRRGAVSCAAFIIAAALMGSARAEDFEFYGIRFGMTKKEVEDAINKMNPGYPVRKRLFKSTGGRYGDYQVDAPGHKILSIYFKFDKKGRLYWMKVNYPYSLSNPGRCRPLREALKREFVNPIRQKHRDVEVTLDEKRMRMTLVHKPKKQSKP